MDSGDEEPETTIEYICSRCGCTRRSSGPVVQHIVDRHDREGTVREHERKTDWRDRLVK